MWEANQSRNSGTSLPEAVGRGGHRKDLERVNVGCSFLPISNSCCVYGLGIPRPLVGGLVGIQFWALGQGGLCSSCLETSRWPCPFSPASSSAMSAFSGRMGHTWPERFWGTSSAGRSVRLWWEEQHYQIHINAGGMTFEGL